LLNNTPKRTAFLASACHIGRKPVIDWQVLDVREDRALLLSVLGWEAGRCPNNKRRVTWDRGALRQWLNPVFYGTGFSAEDLLPPKA